jgi:glycosyltransferase involved in cell wall biosynthesis
MLLVVMIPAFNEAPWIGTAIRAIPREVEGFDHVEVLVVDDGSTDGTGEAAREAGADYVVTHGRNRGLARAFTTGMNRALALGADVIVNTDADGQYDAADIPVLIRPILVDGADLVVGTRPIDAIPHFSRAKRWFQRLGSWAVQVASGTDIPDAPSGFRAFTASAAQRFLIVDRYTYTLEMLIQAGRTGMHVESVPIRVNPPVRPSRLMRSWPSYVRRSIGTIVRIAVTYRPFRFFAAIGSVLIVLGGSLLLRFVILYVQGRGQGNVQSLIIGSLLATSGIQAIMTAFLADAVVANRRLLERLLRPEAGSALARGRGRAIPMARPRRTG